MDGRGDSDGPRVAAPAEGSSPAVPPRPSDAWFRSVVEAANEGIWIIDMEARTIFANERMAAMLATTTDELIGRTPFEFLSEEDRIAGADVMARNFEGFPVEFEITFRRVDGTVIPTLAGSAPLRDEQGVITGSVATFSDLTARKSAEQREFLLAREVDHRAKNLLAVVQAVVQLTRAESTEELKDSVVGRIQSLARAHALLSESRWEGVELSQLVADEMAPFSGRQATFSGPPVRLRPAAAQSLAMVLHELATNAAKYGALSTSDGQLDVSWQVTGEPPKLTLDWTETGRAGVVEPRSQGFGSRIIRTSIERQLQGRVTQSWLDGGLRCRLELGLDKARPAHDA